MHLRSPFPAPSVQTAKIRKTTELFSFYHTKITQHSLHIKIQPLARFFKKSIKMSENIIFSSFANH